MPEVKVQNSNIQEIKDLRTSNKKELHISASDHRRLRRRRQRRRRRRDAVLQRQVPFS